MDKNQSYFYGLFLTDGYLLKHNGKITGIGIEVGIVDIPLIKQLQDYIPFSSIYYRKRKTNFKEEYESCIFQYYRKDLPEQLLSFGFPEFDKTINAKPPNTFYDEVAFWRGVIDGDGSIGVWKNGLSFISLCTKSEQLKQDFCIFLEKITGRKYNPKRNQRDNVYNIGCNGGSAKKVIKNLMENIDDNSLFLPRKYQKMLEILSLN